MTAWAQAGLWPAAAAAAREHTRLWKARLCCLLPRAAAALTLLPCRPPCLQIHGDLKPANVMLKAARNDRRGFICKVRLPAAHAPGSRWACSAAGVPPRMHLCMLIHLPRAPPSAPAQLGDFGLSRMLGAEESHVDTQVRLPCSLCVSQMLLVRCAAALRWRLLGSAALHPALPGGCWMRVAARRTEAQNSLQAPLDGQRALRSFCLPSLCALCSRTAQPATRPPSC